MLESIGSTLPQAVGIAASPLPVIAVIIILMAPNSRRLGILYLLGWLVGIAVATTVFSFLTRVGVDATSEDEAQPILACIKIALGLLLVWLAVRQWRKRPTPGAEPEMPSWMSRLDGLRPATTVALSFGLAANPKNLVMAATAGTVIGASRTVVGDSAWVILVFTLVAGASVALPVLASVIAPAASASALATTRTWLVANNATIMTVVFALLATQNFGDGLALL
ncbi:GAP family protein [Gordonia hydrophobica]|uniref:GAP family protein n=1 Tax=Gordonia hydrophobica TaxID=40516 RepID=A0ABZ2UB95_9ACTN|nr:GAP family protein [Gordonia hydrophobica]MBM7365364.1 threonine/homoserine/homoserine lactone efflux protein [Gordonia hydrophobica]